MESAKVRSPWADAGQSPTAPFAAADHPWRATGLIPVQAILPLPMAPPIISPEDDRTSDAAARELQHLFTHLLDTFVIRERDAFRREFDALAQAATALDHLFDSVEYRSKLRNNVKTLLRTDGQSLATSRSDDPTRDPLDIHHTVPYRAPLARDARRILEKWNISVHDPANAAILPQSYHRGEDVHGMAGDGYSQDVVQSLDRADRRATIGAALDGRAAGRADMFEALRLLSDGIVAASGDERAIALEAKLRALERSIPRPDEPTKLGPRLRP